MNAITIMITLKLAALLPFWEIDLSIWRVNRKHGTAKIFDKSGSFLHHVGQRVEALSGDLVTSHMITSYLIGSESFH